VLPPKKRARESDYLIIWLFVGQFLWIRTLRPLRDQKTKYRIRPYRGTCPFRSQRLQTLRPTHRDRLGTSDKRGVLVRIGSEQRSSDLYAIKEQNTGSGDQAMSPISSKPASDYRFNNSGRSQNGTEGLESSAEL
jgi:hypothetical protein